MAHVKVYRATKYDPNRGEEVTMQFMGTREALKLAALALVEGSGIEVEESELDANWFYHPSAHTSLGRL